MSRVTDPRTLPAEQALDLARSAATTARWLAGQADEQLAEAVSRYNREIAGQDS